jgi:hypothetical protein
VAVVATNAARRRVAFTLRLDPAELGPAGAKFRFVPRYPRAGQPIEGRNGRLEIETCLDGLAVCLYEITAVK